MSSPATSYTPPVTHSDDEVLVRVDGVGKKFCRSLKKSLWYGVCDIAGELLPGRKRQRVAGSELRVAREEAEVAGSEWLVASGNTSAEGASGLVTSHSPLVTPTADHAARDEDLREGEFYAVRDVSFELRRGECLGLIGHNGAGKTTLLKMLNGLIKPDRGTITMRGRVGALIALGAGFNPILTGRENIYINGSVLGLTKKEIDEKIDEIIDFAEIGEFIDMPVQNYSSGMAVRLGFAVATTLEPDILILDEVLAVGDAAFRAKCYKRIGELQDRAAVIFVSHSMEQMARIANSGIVLDRGKVRILGSIEQAIKLYEETETQQSNKNNGFLRYSEEISNCHISIDNCIIKWGGEINIKISFNCSEDLEEITLSGVIYDSTDQVVMSFVSNDKFHTGIAGGVNSLNFKVEKIELHDGMYKIGLAINKKGNINHIVWSYKQLDFKITCSPRGFCKYKKITEITRV